MAGWAPSSVQRVIPVVQIAVATAAQERHLINIGATSPGGMPGHEVVCLALVDVRSAQDTPSVSNRQRQELLISGPPPGPAQPQWRAA